MTGRYNIPESADINNLEVWCALHQNTMRLVTGANVVQGWYRCEKIDHSVVISKASPNRELTSKEEEA